MNFLMRLPAPRGFNYGPTTSRKIKESFDTGEDIQSVKYHYFPEQKPENKG